MQFYTDTFIHKGKIFSRGYKDGQRFNKIDQYKPYLFVNTKEETKWKNLQGKFVDKIQFDSIRDAKNYTFKYKDVAGYPFYGLTDYVYTYIYDNYKDIQYDTNLIRVCYTDIEVEYSNGFPDIQIAANEITAITIMQNNLYLTFGCKDYESDDKNQIYIKCKDEKELLLKFLDHWERFDPDVVSGWNIEFFDIPYLINRIKNVLGESHAKRLSYWKILKEKTIKFRGKDLQGYSPLGVAVLDYYHLYRKFTQNQQESYKLDHIAFVELEEKKIDYSEYDSLNELYDLDYNKFIKYNIHDTALIKQLNDKNKFIELVFAISYDAGVNYVDALTSVKLWDVIIHNYLMNKGIVIPQQKITAGEWFPGAFVKEPQIGMHEWIVSFDLTSLYPMLIQMYNISPETFMGEISENKKVSIDNMDDFASNMINVKPYLEEHNLTMAANGTLFTKNKLGFLSDLMAIQFRLRDEYKKQMIYWKKEKEKNPSHEIENKISMYYNMQWSKKIQLNSAYGAIGNAYFRFYNKSLAEAITKSGQLSTRWIENKLNKYLNKLLNTNKDYIIASDTDSVYVNMSDLVNSVFEDQSDKSKIVNFLDKISKEQIQKYIDTCYQELFELVNGMKQTMSMKREAIADKGLWRAAKMYIINVYDNEGVRYEKPDLKTVGIETVRSTTPHACKEALKESINIIINGTEKELQKYVIDFKKMFVSLPYQDIAMPRGVTDLLKWQTKTGWKTGAPIHVKGSIVYNNLLKKHKLENKYQLIYNGDKIKFLYLKNQNPTDDKVISFSGNIPEQFDMERFIDRDHMFEKTFVQPLKSLTDIVGWDIEKNDNLLGWIE